MSIHGSVTKGENMNACVSSNRSDTRQCYITFSNREEDRVENTTRSGVCFLLLMRFEVLEYVMKHSLVCSMYLIKALNGTVNKLVFSILVDILWLI